MTRPVDRSSSLKPPAIAAISARNWRNEICTTIGRLRGELSARLMVTLTAGPPFIETARSELVLPDVSLGLNA